jgi:hypothetical protein
MTDTRESLREALSGWGSLFGIILTATAIVNILINSFHLELSEVLGAVLEGYRGIFHYPLRAAEALFGIHVPPIIRDCIVLWLIGAGSTLRMNRRTYNANDFKAQFGFWASVKSAEWRRPATYTNFRCSIILNFYHPVWRTIVAIFTWPLVLRILFRRTPIIFVAQAGRQDLPRHYVYAGPEMAADLEAGGYRRGFDLRKIFWTQVTAAVLIAITTAITNGLGTQVIKPAQ